MPGWLSYRWPREFIVGFLRTGGIEEPTEWNVLVFLTDPWEAVTQKIRASRWSGR